MPKVFMIEPAKNHLEKPEVSYYVTARWQIFFKNTVNRKMLTSERSTNQSINQFHLSHTTRYKQQNAQKNKQT